MHSWGLVYFLFTLALRVLFEVQTQNAQVLLSLFWQSYIPESVRNTVSLRPSLREILLQIPGLPPWICLLLGLSLVIHYFAIS